MANYGKKYQCTFDSLVSQPYTLLSLRKDYTGPIRNVQGGATPVIHAWDTDDPKPGIKGSNLRISLINDGSLSINDFYSVEDDGFKVQLYWTTQLLFEGFLVQDDHSEDLLDYTHEILLSANDNLGLLKDIALNKTPLPYNLVYSYTGNYTSVTPDDITVEPAFGAQLQLGDVIRIEGTPQAGYYTVKQLDQDPSTGYWIVHVIEIISTSSGVVSGTLSILRSLFNQKVTLFALIKNCLQATGVNIGLRVFANLHEVNQSGSQSFLEQTLINPDTFLRSETEYQDCYTALNSILERFHLTLFQAEGWWNIVRWDELRYYGNQIDGIAYDNTFTYIGITTMGIPIPAGPLLQTYPETGLINRVFRPFKHTKETFNYKSPANLLRNYNLQDLGQLLSTYSTGTGTGLVTHKEYAFKWWSWTNAFPTSGTAATYFIRVDTDYLGNELTRYVVVRNNGIHSINIEANKGDSFTLSFTVNSDISLPGPANLVFIVKITDGTNTKFLREPTNASPGWQNGTGWVYSIPTGDNIQNTHTVDIDANVAPIPFDGLLTVYLTTETPNPANETRYKDIRFQYIPKINESTKITGQTHINNQPPTIKQVQDTVIALDDAPKNSIDGCLYLNTMTGLLQTRTTSWKVQAFTTPRKLGEQTTFEQLFWRRIPRTILEGSFRGLVNGSYHMSALTVIKYAGGAAFLLPLNFVFGKLEIDYKNDRINSSTLWEIWNDTETDADLTHDYLFNYIYQIN